MFWAETPHPLPPYVVLSLFAKLMNKREYFFEDVIQYITYFKELNYYYNSIIIISDIV